MSDYGSSFTIQIFNSQSIAASTVSVSWGGHGGLEEMGTSPNGNLNVTGTTSFAAGSALGTGYDVELLAAPGSGAAFASLAETGPVITTWYTASGGNPATGFSGFYKTGINVAIANAAAQTVASVALAAWNNEGGTINSLAAAQAAGDPWGVSSEGTSGLLGGGTQQPPNLPSSITSFSLTSTPEPSTFALGVIGASAFLMRLRRKQ